MPTSNVMDIHVAMHGSAGVLSNLHKHSFVFDGVQCGGMEGLIQSLRYKNVDEQLHMAGLYGIQAKRLGDKKNWRAKQELYWKGVPFNRHSDAYQAFLDNAYDALAIQSERFRSALIDSDGKILTHTVGRTDPYITLLTQEEFLCRLNRLRSSLMTLRCAAE